MEVTTEVLCCGATGLLVEESKKARLVVIGSRGLGTITGLLVGSTAVALAAHGHSPVVEVRGTETPHGPVVVGVDGSPTSEAALAFAFEAASMRGVVLIAVMTSQDFTVDSAYNVSRIAIDWAQEEEDERRSLAQRLAGWQEKYPEVEVHRIVLRDRPARALVRYGAEAQLLVVGSHEVTTGTSAAALGPTSPPEDGQPHCPAGQAGQRLNGMNAADVMTSPAVVVNPTTAVRAASALLGDRGFSALPVVDDDSRLVGIVSGADLLVAGMTPETANGPVARVMRKSVISAPTTATPAS